MNIILDNANEDVLVTMSADNLPTRGSLNELLLPFRDARVGTVTGRPVPLNDRETFWGYVSHLIWGLHHELCMRKKAKLSGEFCAIRPNLVKKIPYNVINDDVYVEWLIRKQSHYKIVYAPKPVSLMRGANNLQDFVTQRRRVAQGHLQIYDETTERRFISPTYDFLKVVPVMLTTIGHCLKYLFWSLIASFLEAYCHVLARYDRLRGRTSYI